jgi:hypothetical protein
MRARKISRARPRATVGRQLDVRLAWRAQERLELSLIGQNLLPDHHAELSSPPFGGVERGIYGRVALRY